MTPYKIILYSTDFDSSYDNTIRFNTRQEQKNYFNGLASKTPELEINFNLGTLLNAEATVDVPLGGQNAMGYNYAIISKNGDRDLFYFIEEIKYNTSNRISLRLTLDVIQTYYLDLNFEPCLIKRAHINRWIVKNNLCTFNTKLEDAQGCALFEREELKNLPQYITKLQRCSFSMGAGGNTITSKWIYDNILCWVYIYIQEGLYKNYKWQSTTDTEDLLIRLGQGKFDADVLKNKILLPYGVLCYPLYRNDKKILIRKPNTTEVTEAKNILTDLLDINSMAGTNNLEPRILSIKVSPMPPMNPTFNFNMEVNADGDLVIDYAVTNDILAKGKTGAMFNVFFQEEAPHILYSLADNQNVLPVTTHIFNFTKEQIKRTGNAEEYNPKCYTEDVRQWGYTTGTNEKMYGSLKLNASFNLKYYESLSPDTTRQYIYLDKDENAPITKTVYDFEHKSCGGLLCTADMSMPFAVDQLQAFLGQNKNFFLQKEAGYNLKEYKANVRGGLAITGGILGGGAKMLSGSFDKGLIRMGAGVAGGAMSIDFAKREIALDRAMVNYTFDNMQNAPDTMKDLSGNIMQILQANECAIYIKETTATAHDKKMYNDQTRLYGFTYNRIDDPKNYDNIRKSYNFVQADIHAVNTSYGISQYIREEIRKVFSNGIRFWNLDGGELFNENNQNYERVLDNA